MNAGFLASLGAPELKLGCLSLWVHGWESENAEDFYGANWLRVTAHCGAEGASATVSGSLLLAADLERWLQEIEKLYETLSGSAVLEPPEPNLVVRLSAGSLGSVTGEVEITPDPLTQAHLFRFELDPSFLPSIASQLRTLLARWPVRRVG
jgi:hypothetical protein